MKSPLLTLGCVAVFLLAAHTSFGQRPSLKVDGSESADVSLQQLDINVVIAGTLATTTWTMTFKNHSSRRLEGELTFPLGEGIDISRYALDINGHMREGVPVEKTKGALVFESVERRRVDPGLLEKLEGNSFRTRIYPFNPGAARTVLIGYEEQLHFGGDGTLRYRLPLGITQEVPTFNLNIHILQSHATPLLEEDMNSGLTFTKAAEEYRISKQFKNYAPDHPISISLPKQKNSVEVVMQKKGSRYYYLVNSFMEGSSVEKRLPHQLSIVWDVSLSSRNRNIEKELHLLDDYISQIGDAQIDVLCFGNTIVSEQQFLVTDGDSHALRNYLRKARFDGATNLSCINFARLPGEEVLLFSDGHNTFYSDELSLGKKAVHCITSSTRSDFSNLHFITENTGGNFINLSGSSVDEALRLLCHQPLRFLGIKPHDGLRAHYPSLPLPVGSGFSVAGITEHPYDTITLLFGYGHHPIREKAVILDYNKQMTTTLNVSRIWAEKKINELSTRFEDNKEEIGRLGKLYGIATRNTSLIVLETAQDYVTYNIQPPAELQQEYAQIIKHRKDQYHERDKLAKENATKYMKGLKDWYSTEWKPTKPKAEAKSRQERADRSQAANTASRSQLSQRTEQANTAANDLTGELSGTVYDEQTEPIIGAIVQLFQQGVRRGGTATNIDGNYSIKPLPPAANYELQIRYAGYKPVTIRNVLIAPDRFTHLNVNMDPSNQGLQEVVVKEYKVPMVESEQQGSTTTYTREEISRLPTRNTSDATILSGGTYQQRNGNIATSAGGRTGGTQVIIDGVATAVDGDNNNGVLTGEEILALTEAVGENGDSADYMLIIRKTPRDQQYDTYLSLMSKEGYRPTFFLRVADYFFYTKREATALRILSNIAELGIEDYELYKMMGYKLREMEEYDAAVYCFKKVLNWRPQEPQSYRDYGLALEDVGEYQRAFDTLYTALTYEYSTEQMNLYEGYQEVLLTEINELLAKHGKKLHTRELDKQWIATMPVDLRVVLNWNMGETDVDLWVTDPDSEKCFYSHPETAIGGRLTDDFTDGFGPEQFELRKAKKGTYVVQANYFNDRVQKIAGPTTVLAEIYTYYGTKWQQRQLITLQLDKEGERTAYVGEVEFK
ncbi:MAG TPA: VIT domain-containing protein [Flavipsychrobacter sp.]|nr:VIT domain-containing protein [Flavipsychrobacter sp.]